MKRSNVRLSAEEQALIESLLMRNATAQNPSPGFKDELYGRLVRTYMQRQEISEPVVGGLAISLRSFVRFWTVTAMVLLCVAGSGFTTAYAYISPEVTRESNLYFLKQAVEKLELLASLTPEQQSRLHLKLANRRLEEATVLSQEGTVDEPTLQEMVSHTELAKEYAQVVVDAGTQISLNSTIASETERQRTSLVALVSQMEAGSTDMSFVPSSASSSISSESASASSEVSGEALSSESASSSSVSSSDATGSTPAKVPAPSPVVASAPMNDASTLGALERTIADIGKVEMSAKSAAMEVSEKSGIATSASPRLPDLAIAFESDSTVLEGDPFNADIRVMNVGMRGSAATKLILVWGDRGSETFSIPMLDRDEDHVVSARHTYQNPGQYVIRAQVDPSGALQELTTANNRAALNVTVTPLLHHDCPESGERRCLGQVLEECGYLPGSQERSWMPMETCAGSEECTLDGCVQAVTPCAATCREGEKRCYEKNVQVCAQINGCPGWKDVQTCYGSQLCSDGQCRSSVCGNGSIETGEECDDANSKDGDGCSATCKRETCDDSDGGQNSSVAGTVYFGVQGLKNNAQDSCAGTSLMEHYCEGNAHRVVQVNCPYGCREGACLQPRSFICGNGILEASEECDDGNTTSGDGCSGTCKKESVVPVTCTDSDGGIIPGQKGTTTIVKAGGTSVSDYCESTGVLREYYCLGDASLSSVSTTCQYGCSDGACLPQPAAVCGNGKVETGEECDDGDRINGDGCSTSCRVEALSCAMIKTQTPLSATNGTVTAYAKDYGLFLCAAGNDVPVEVESRNSGVNYPGIAGDNLLYFKSYGITLYNVSTKVKTELEPASSGSNYPVIAGKYVAYFKNYGIILYNTDTRQKTQVEQPNSGCNGPRISGTTLTYTCNGVSKTYAIEGPACGNGKVETGEQCDDGNTVSGDGCSSSCQIVSRFTLSNVQLSCDRQNVTFYYSRPNDGVAPKLLLVSDNSSLLLQSTLLLVSPAASIMAPATSFDMVKLQPGVSVKLCNGNNTSECSAPVTVTSRGGNGIVESPEQCDDGNTVSGDGCSALCQTESLDLSMTTPVLQSTVVRPGGRIVVTETVRASGSTGGQKFTIFAAVTADPQSYVLNISESFGTCRMNMGTGEAQCTDVPVDTPITIVFDVPATAACGDTVSFLSMVQNPNSDPTPANNAGDIDWISITCP